MEIVQLQGDSLEREARSAARALEILPLPAHRRFERREFANCDPEAVLRAHTAASAAGAAARLQAAASR